MLDAPKAEKGLHVCATCHELWATVAGELYLYTKHCEECTKVANQAGGTCKVGACC